MLRLLPGEMAGAGQRKGKKDDNGISTAIDFVLSNARLVLGVGGAAMLGIATLAVKRVSERASERDSRVGPEHGGLGKKEWETKRPEMMGKMQMLGP